MNITEKCPCCEKWQDIDLEAENADEIIESLLCKCISCGEFFTLNIQVLSNTEACDG